MSIHLQDMVINPLKHGDTISDIDLWHQGRMILLHKPIDWTSYDLVHKCKLALKYNLGIPKIKIGHAGTLDPKATGLMIVLTGGYTKLTDSIHELKKKYLAQVFLGGTTPCYDSERPIDTYFPIKHITVDMVKASAASFVGSNIKQYPPVFSAVRINGRKAYKSAHHGLPVVTRPRFVDIHELTIIDVRLPLVDMEVLCSSGTYIRSLAFDLGRALDTGAYLNALIRTQIGTWDLSQALTPEEFISILKSDA